MPFGRIAPIAASSENNDSGQEHTFPPAAFLYINIKTPRRQPAYPSGIFYNPNRHLKSEAYFWENMCSDMRIGLFVYNDIMGRLFQL